jgi:Papain-like cysteine protease AvrRpt2
MTWGLYKDGVLYDMDGEFYAAKLTVKKTQTGDPILPSRPHAIIFDLDNNADVPGPMGVKAKPQGALLTVPYWKQTDNFRDANRTCFSSSMAMITEYLKPDELPDDDTYVETVFSIGDTTDPNVQVKALAHHGIIGTYRQKMDFYLLDIELYGSFPVGVAILHRGPLNAPTGGHWIVCTGVSADGSKYRFNDPYGSLMDGYQGAVENGKDVWYSREILVARWTADGPGSGWGMTCRKKA